MEIFDRDSLEHRPTVELKCIHFYTLVLLYSKLIVSRLMSNSFMRTLIVAILRTLLLRCVGGEAVYKFPTRKLIGCSL